jgi:hypothetical protein
LKSDKTDFTTNYCGPYYSDGSIQRSVANGKKKPVSNLDNSCRDHDTRYALSNGDFDKLDEADEIFFREQFGKGFKASTYASVVKYGNKITRKTESLLIPLFGIVADFAVQSLLPQKGQRFQGTPDDIAADKRAARAPRLVYNPPSKFRPIVDSQANFDLPKTSTVAKQKLAPVTDASVYWNPYSTDKKKRFKNRSRSY